MSSTSAHANSLPALGVGATEESEAHSLLQPPILVEALLISAALHAVATAVLGVPPGAPALHFVLFAVSDIVLNALAVIPLVAVRRSLLAWHDPLAYLGALFLLSTSTFYFVYLLSPALLHGYVAFFGYNFSGVSQPALLQVFIRAVLVQCSYFAIVLVFNRRPLNQTFVRVGKSEEAYGAALAGVLLVGLGMYSFVRLRATPYFSYVIDNLGRSWRRRRGSPATSCLQVSLRVPCHFSWPVGSTYRPRSRGSCPPVPPRRRRLSLPSARFLL